VGYTSLKGLKSLSDEVAKSLEKGIRESERREQDFVVLTTYKELNLSESAALTLSEVVTFILLKDDVVKKVEKALKAYAQAGASLKPKETAEVCGLLSSSESPAEIRGALEHLDKMGANEADWLKVMFSKNILRRLMRVNPENLHIFSDGPPAERQPIWQALAEYLGKHAKTREWFKWEAAKYFELGDFAADLASKLTPELAPILSCGTRSNGIIYSEPVISEEKAALFSTLACHIRFTGMKRLQPETIRALSSHRSVIEFHGITELEPESAEALSHCSGEIRFQPDRESDSLMKLSDESAFALAKGRFSSLDLYIEPISEEAAKALAGNRRIHVEFPSE
jgi:hypothetical protein